VQLSNQEAERLIRIGVDALRQGRPATAREHFERVTQTGRANGQIWLLLAAACRADDDTVGEEAALDRVLALEPRLVRALIMKADCRAKAGDERAALNFYESALLIAAGQQTPNDLVPELRRAEAWVAQVKARVEEQRESALRTRGVPPEIRSPRFQKSLDILSGRKRIFVQEPTGYYFPELPQIQFYDPARFDWVPDVEAAAGAIRNELEAILAVGTEGFRPYLKRDANRPRMDDNHLLDSKDWSALFLCENGKMFEKALEQCPHTWEAVQAAPLPRIANSPTVMFSLLRAGARIAPHTGTHNARLICHLPLIVPSNCGFRVGNEVRQWEEGKLLIFDDTIEHEAWNESAEDRVVLIFDVWRPELSERERSEVAALFQGPALE
jgi:aspartyl/asparaginyl beta-hydroxylase (cupin superfamily)